MVYDEFLTERVSLEKPDGTRYEGIKAAITEKDVLITDISLPIAKGDRIIQALPGSAVRMLEVLDVLFEKADGDIPDMYLVSYREATGS